MLINLLLYIYIYTFYLQILEQHKNSLYIDENNGNKYVYKLELSKYLLQTATKELIHTNQSGIYDIKSKENTNQDTIKGFVRKNKIIKKVQPDIIHNNNNNISLKKDENIITLELDREVTCAELNTLRRNYVSINKRLAPKNANDIIVSFLFF